MHIVQITSEIAPAAKVGGLSDVVLGLSRELLRQGHQVEVLLPDYAALKRDEIDKWEPNHSQVSIFLDDQFRSVSVGRGLVRDVPVWFIGAPEGYSFLDHDSVYGGADELLRFLSFSRGALDWLLFQHSEPDIIHSHDWPTAVVPVLLREVFTDTPLGRSKTLFSLHNVDYQGRCSKEDLHRIGLDGRTLLHPERLQDNQWEEAINLMKGGIVFSDGCNTVSPTYAEQVRTAPEGRGLELTINKHQQKFSGILNGIDYTYWNPAEDTYIDHHFSLEQMKAGDCSGKKAAKAALQRALYLPVTDAPLIACISRLIPQKGIDLMRHAVHRISELGGQFVLLGSSLNSDIQAAFEQQAVEHSRGNSVRFCLKTSERLAHQIYAAADMILVPSIFEPCGLTQMIALRYGCVPLVRKTGGLADTVHDVETSIRPLSERNGFSFEHADIGGVNWALDRSIKMYREKPQKWKQLVINGMRQDHSWNRSVRGYMERYQGILGHLPVQIK